MLEVHHLNNSRSQRVLWLLEELGVPYEIKAYQRDATTMLAPESLKKIHPLGKSPVIRDGDQVVNESGAIIEYIVRKYGKGKLAPPESSPDWPRYLVFMHYAEGSAMLPLMLLLYTGRLGEAGAPLRPRITSEIDNHFGWLDSQLAGREWFVGGLAHRRRHPALVRDPGLQPDVRDRQVPQPEGLPRPHPRAPGLQARARARRALRVRELSQARRIRGADGDSMRDAPADGRPAS